MFRSGKIFEWIMPEFESGTCQGNYATGRLMCDEERIGRSRFGRAREGLSRRVSEAVLRVVSCFVSILYRTCKPPDSLPRLHEQACQQP